MASELSTSVTGASGFIASRLVADLLSAGYEVRGTVRDASDLEKYKYLTSLDGANERLTLVSANLLEPKSFDEAIGRVPSTDNSKIKRDLGLEFRHFGESLKDAVTDMKTWGHVASKS